MDISPTRHRPNAVLMLGQHLRRWTNIKPTLGECVVLPGEARTVNMRGSQLFLAPHGKTFVSQPKAHLKELANYLLLNIAQIYTEFS